MSHPLSLHKLTTSRHRTVWLEAGPASGPLMIFVHGWPQIGLLWRKQLEHFARAGWRCVAPDMRGFGGSSVPTDPGAYTMRQVVEDMVELHQALGASPAVWVGHDWGSPVVSALAAHHVGRCRAVVNISVPYFPQGFALEKLVPLVDRQLHPEDRYPYGQWDYYRFYQENPEQAAEDFEADVTATMANLFRSGSAAAIGKPSPTATVRENGGRFGAARRAPSRPRDESMMSQADFDTLVRAFSKTGFRGADSWYLNDSANISYAAQSPDNGRLSLPVLFLNGAWDPICDITRGRLGEPMRTHCTDLTEVSIEGGHWLMLERSTEVNTALTVWLASDLLLASRRLG